MAERGAGVSGSHRTSQPRVGGSISGRGIILPFSASASDLDWQSSESSHAFLSRVRTTRRGELDGSALGSRSTPIASEGGQLRAQSLSTGQPLCYAPSDLGLIVCPAENHYASYGVSHTPGRGGPGPCLTIRLCSPLRS
jgi:hypothetical protein